MDIETKKRIDQMDYESMLRLWRNASGDHPYFHGEVGEYFGKAMAEKKAGVGDGGHVAASKNIGWDGK